MIETSTQAMAPPPKGEMRVCINELYEIDVSEIGYLNDNQVKYNIRILGFQKRDKSRMYGQSGSHRSQKKKKGRMIKVSAYCMEKAYLFLCFVQKVQKL